MKTQKAGWMAAAAALVFAAVSVQAATLATWPLTVKTGETEYPEALSVGDFVGGKAISVSFSSSGASSSGWTSTALNSNAYYEFSITATADYYLELSDLVMNLRSTKTGPGEAEVRYSLDAEHWTTAATLSLPKDSTSNPYGVDLSSVSVNTGQTLLIRIYAWGASGSTGTFRVNAKSDKVTPQLAISGVPVGTATPPVIAFPHEAESVGVSNTLEVAISVLPDGDITSWSFSPQPAGAFSLSDNVFTFKPVAADEGGDFTLSVTASNSHGDTDATLPVTVTAYVPAGAWTTGFENGKNPAYAASTNWPIDGRAWSIQQLAFLDSETLPKVGSRVCVFGSYSEAFMVSNEKLPGANGGCGTVSFLYAEYPDESEACQPLIVEISTDPDGAGWMELGRVNPTGASDLTEAAFELNTSESVYLRIRTEYVNGSGRVCMDQLTVTPYKAPVRTDFEKYLLKYNVTPGDPGCASERVWAEGETADSYKTDDFDEDGYSNWAEFKANPQTNPYDRTSHP